MIDTPKATMSEAKCEVSEEQRERAFQIAFGYALAGGERDKPLEEVIAQALAQEAQRANERAVGLQHKLAKAEKKSANLQEQLDRHYAALGTEQQESKAQRERAEGLAKELEALRVETKELDWYRAAHVLLANGESFIFPDSGSPFFFMAGATKLRQPMLALNMGDVFAWGCADAEPFGYFDAPKLLEIVKRDGFTGLIAWAKEQRLSKGDSAWDEAHLARFTPDLPLAEQNNTLRARVAELEKQLDAQADHTLVAAEERRVARQSADNFKRAEFAEAELAKLREQVGAVGGAPLGDRELLLKALLSGAAQQNLGGKWLVVYTGDASPPPRFRIAKDTSIEVTDELRAALNDALTKAVQ